MSEERKKGALFINTSGRSVELLREALFYNYLKRPGFVALHAAMAVLLALEWFVCWYVTGVYTGALTLTAVFAATVAIQLLRCNAAAKRRIARDRECYGEEALSFTVWIDGEGVYEESSFGAHADVAMKNIRYAYQTKRLIVLITRAMQVIMMEKAGFSAGTTQELTAFLKEKGIRVG